MSEFERIGRMRKHRRWYQLWRTTMLIPKKLRAVGADYDSCYAAHVPWELVNRRRRYRVG